MLLGALSVTATIFLIWLLCTLAVHALPVWAGGAAAWFAYHSGAGILGAGIVGIVVAGLTLGFGELAFARLRSPFARVVLAAAFTIPAMIAGYYAALGIGRWAVPDDTWRTIFAGAASLVAGTVSLARLASGPHLPGQGAAGPSSVAAGSGTFAPKHLPAPRSEQAYRWERPPARRRSTR